MITPDPAFPDFSGVQSSSSSESMSREEAATPTYTVVAGDSLSKIAKHHYGDASKWKLIHEANRDLITNPDLIQIGWELKLPQL